MRHTITRAEQIQQAYQQNDLELAHRLEVDSSSVVVRRAISGFYVKDPAPTQRPYMSEQAIRDRKDLT
jgi:hypothetical protein